MAECVSPNSYHASIVVAKIFYVSGLKPNFASFGNYFNACVDNPLDQYESRRARGGGGGNKRNEQNIK